MRFQFLMIIPLFLTVSACKIGSLSSSDAAVTGTTTTTTTSATTLPTGIVMVSIPGDTFVMGDNNLKGPQSGQASEHNVTLSAYTMSETEITNAQYVEFLNAALAKGLIEVATGTTAGDTGKSIIVGSAGSSYSGKVLYSLEGTRVMKDHNNADMDSKPFTGSIEPENPLNIAYIGFNTTSKLFYVKDPRVATDFHWKNLCNYYDYTSTEREEDTSVQQNDFSNWSELAGWTETSPSSATKLPTQADVSAYPVTFIRWWGAKAFALFYSVNLPSEAQWEYAAKGGKSFTYSVHDGVTTADANWNQAHLEPALHTVRAAKSGTANPFGLYNLGGNVWEWMEDNYEAYATSDAEDPVISVSGSTLRSWRGGSWNYHQATLETAGRFSDEEDRGNDHF
jgi:sulfatase modifying factor 1